MRRRPHLHVDEKRRLAGRVRVGGFYTDGTDLIEITAVNEHCVLWHNVRYDGPHFFDRCLGITDFRDRFWLVREAA